MLYGEKCINTTQTRGGAYEFEQVQVTNAPRNLHDQCLGYFIANTETDTRTTTAETRERDGAGSLKTCSVQIVFQLATPTIVCSPAVFLGLPV